MRRKKVKNKEIKIELYMTLTEAVILCAVLDFGMMKTKSEAIRKQYLKYLNINSIPPKHSNNSKSK